jgi:D-3-phosphoglycerate dehydrogenase
MAKGFGLDVRAFDPYLMRQGWQDKSVPAETDLLRALEKADVVSIHIPKSDRPILGKEELAWIKEGAIVINCARGGIVDEVALAAAIREGRVGAAGIDVFGSEPPEASHALLGLDQVILTPHNAALTAECGERMAIASVQNVLDFFAGRLDPTLVVNGVDIGRKGAVA